MGLLTPITGSRILLLALDHAAADLWSLSLVLDELGRLCAGESLESTPGDPSVFAHDERERLAADEGARLRAYWRELLDGVPIELDLPCGSRPAILSGRGHTVRLSLGPSSGDRLREIAGSLGATPAAVGLAAFRLFLSKIGRNPDVVIGVPTALRANPGTRATVGFLVNTVPVRVKMDGIKSVAGLVRASCAGLAASIAGAGLPLADIFRAARSPRSDGGELVRAMYAHTSDPPGLGSLVPLALEDEGTEVMLAGGLTLRPVALPEQAVPSDFEVTTGESRGEVLIRFGASADLFETEPAERLANQFAELFRQMLEEPCSTLSDVGLMDVEAKSALLAATQSHGPRPDKRSLVELFLQSANLYPDEPAVTFKRRALSYGELLSSVRATATALPRTPFAKSWESCRAGSRLGTLFRRRPASRMVRGSWRCAPCSRDP